MNQHETAIVQLGKFGDICNLLPIAKHLHNSGKTPHWVVSINYMSILAGVDYVHPDPVHFSVTRIKDALNYAKARYGNVLNGQPYGKEYTGPKDDSYNLLAWKSCGFGEHFDDVNTFPLVFNKRDFDREDFLAVQHGCKNTGAAIILLAIGCARSSPFPSRSILMDSIYRKHGNRCHIIDLCDVKAARIYDLLGLFEKATVLITADTYALHLAAAVPTLPVIALVNDKPFLSTRPRCRVVLKLKYSEAAERVKDVHQSVFDAARIREGFQARSLGLESGVVAPEQSCRHLPPN